MIQYQDENCKITVTVWNIYNIWRRKKNCEQNL